MYGGQARPINLVRELGRAVTSAVVSIVKIRLTQEPRCCDRY